jgi:hypothetical protein
MINGITSPFVFFMFCLCYKFINLINLIINSLRGPKTIPLLGGQVDKHLVITNFGQSNFMLNKMQLAK